MSLFLSALPYTGFIFCLYNPYIAPVFILSALLGLGGAIIWTANGEVLTAYLRENHGTALKIRLNFKNS